MNRIKKIIIFSFAFSVIAFICFGGKLHASESDVILVEKYEISDGEFTPGGTVTLKIRLYNASPDKSAKGIKVSFTSSCGISPVYKDDNQVYIDSMGPRETRDMEFEVDIPKDITLEKAGIDLSISYSYSSTKESSENFVSLAIPVQYNSSFIINNVSAVDSVMHGSKALISISYTNGSGSELKDVSFLLEGNIPEEEKKIEVGNIEAGVSQYQDIYVEFYNTGEQSMDISISYKDKEGNVFVKEIASKNIVVIEEEIEEEKMVVDQPEKSEIIKKKIFKAIVMILIVINVFGILYYFARKKE
ncbi:MAG: hypothetical protein II992_00830 [Lachnospiraceae bacterium]|nr:hypothetical protein [Lachnospiraceae bacterium]